MKNSLDYTSLSLLLKLSTNTIRYFRILAGFYSRQNRLATALREMGRRDKTIFILHYISDESFTFRCCGE
nr:transposase [Gottfriedia solisilvae]